MPRVVPDQRSKFENEEFFRKLSRECEIKYTGFRDRPHEERQARFQNACRDGRSEIAFVATGTNLSLQFFPANLHGDQRQAPTREYVDFERETGKVYLKAPMILNGVCVIWRGWIDLQRLDGMGCLEYDEERARHEDALAQQAYEEVRRRNREFEDRDRSHREDLEVRGRGHAGWAGPSPARGQHTKFRVDADLSGYIRMFRAHIQVSAYDVQTAVILTCVCVCVSACTCVCIGLIVFLQLDMHAYVFVCVYV
uniref:Core-binding factor subunit beta n=1 Tax=Paramormyrops kingsleyae TaxID=1676925 RepID=A0A3B3RB64_9TELE